MAAMSPDLWLQALRPSGSRGEEPCGSKIVGSRPGPSWVARRACGAGSRLGETVAGRRSLEELRGCCSWGGASCLGCYVAVAGVKVAPHVVHVKYKAQHVVFPEQFPVMTGVSGRGAWEYKEFACGRLTRASLGVGSGAPVSGRCGSVWLRRGLLLWASGAF